MLSAIVRVTPGQPVEALGATLASLVPAVIHGLIGDALILSPDRDDEVAQVADAAGVALVVDDAGPEGWRQAARAARGRWVLLLAAGDRLESGWMIEAERALMASPPGAARLRRRPASLPDRLVQTLRDMLRPGSLSPGLLITRDMLIQERPRTSPIRRLPILIDSVS